MRAGTGDSQPILAVAVEVGLEALLDAPSSPGGISS